MSNLLNSSAPDRQSPPQTVFVVDDDVSFLRAVCRLLRASGFQVAGFDSAEGFLGHLQPGQAGCVILDLQMPGMGGMALQQALRDADCPLPTVFLTGHGNIPTTVLAMRGGAEDFLTKRAPRAELIDAVRRALTNDAAKRAERDRVRTLRQRFDNLTDREREVLRGVLLGKLNKQIAADLGIHERTVKLHRTSLTGKLGIHSAAGLALLAQEAGWRGLERAPEGAVGPSRPDAQSATGASDGTSGAFGGPNHTCRIRSPRFNPTVLQPAPSGNHTPTGIKSPPE